MVLNALRMTTVQVDGATAQVGPLVAEGYAQLNCQMARIPMHVHATEIQMVVPLPNVHVGTVVGKCHRNIAAQRMTTVGVVTVEDGSHLVAEEDANSSRIR